MSLLLTVATRRELLAVEPRLSALPTPEHEVFELSGPDVLACVTGVGPVNAALAMGLVLGGRKDVSAVLNTGLAGSFDLEKAPLGSIVIAGEECWPEYGFWGKQGFSAEELGFCQWAGGLAGKPAGSSQTFSGTADLYDRLPLSDEPPHPWLAPPAGFLSRRGVFITVAGVSGTCSRAAELQKRYAALAENMEGFAVAYACARFGLPFAEMRAISNLAGSREPGHRAFPAALAAMGDFVRSLIAKNKRV